MRAIAQPLGRDVGRIGLQHQRRQRQTGGEPADALRTAVGHGAAEAQLETARQELRGLLLRAIEGVQDAARHLDPAQLAQQGVGRSAHVYHHRQAEVARQAQLRAIKVLLPGHVGRGDEKVQADLADADEARVVQRRASGRPQLVQVRLGGLIEPERMQAERVGMAERARHRGRMAEAGRMHGRQDRQRHPRRARPRVHRRPVGVVLGRIEVAVGVDPHGA